ncbi:MAG: tetratricopeptide repeat protein [Gammaproteobacteria bacterium]|nr:tetratricopeptide repeat protein [Gammaproteobacteria bacterium]
MRWRGAAGTLDAWTALGQCLQRRERLEDALAAFRTALEITPGHLNAVAGLGHTLRLMDRFDDAAACYDAALRSHPDALQIRTARAAIDVNQGRHEAAERRYREVLERDPENVTAHRELNELLWQLGRTDEYTASFETAVTRSGADPDLLQAWCEALAGGGRFPAVLEVLDRHAPDAREPGLLRMRARALAAQGEHGPAMDLFVRTRALAPDDPDTALDHAQLAIVEGAYDSALEALEQVEALAPDHQLMWACRGLCWRLKGDGRAHWLNDPERLVRTRRIECPPGFASLDAFLTELGSRLEELHLTRSAPSNQTLRGGTQTFGRLFHRDEPLIRALVGALSRTISEHLAELPRDPSHPMLRRRNGRFRFSGSWSVRLAPGGYHVNHVHPAGWLSSAFYVSVPDDLGTSEADPAGWLEIGESDLGLGERERIDQLIRPMAGELTLFPSYTWHGTVPFHGSATRLTAPFDLVPG